MDQNLDFTVTELGECKIASPKKLSNIKGDSIVNFVFPNEYIANNIEVKPGESLPLQKENLLERAGPREKIYFNPAKVHAGIVTCGGLCPGLNDVIRSIVMSLWYGYGVRRISGIKFGYRGLLPEYGLSDIQITPEYVEDIHTIGGTVLGSSRGLGDKVSELVDALERSNLNMLFTIGGDGTQRAARDIADECMKRGLKIAVVGIPKTIDNDLSFIEKSFGFETAVSKAVDAVSAAHMEAKCSINGVGVVKVMGRESGFIAAYTTLARNDVNYVLIPEVPFELEGENGLLNQIRIRLKDRNHAVVLVAEGAGQKLLETNNETDASGNKKLGDIGIFLSQKIKQYFKEQNTEINLKYIDPSYIIRSAPANPMDSVFCARLGSNAVHAAMAGKTKVLISMINSQMVHVPMNVAVKERNRIDPESPFWRDVLEATGQPPKLGD